MEEDVTDIDDREANERLGEASKIDEILKYFRYEGATPVRRGFAFLALCVVAVAPRCPERSVALRKLLEALDAVERACRP